MQMAYPPGMTVTASSQQRAFGNTPSQNFHLNIPQLHAPSPSAFGRWSNPTQQQAQPQQAHAHAYEQQWQQPRYLHRQSPEIPIAPRSTICGPSPRTSWDLSTYIENDSNIATPGHIVAPASVSAGQATFFPSQPSTGPFSPSIDAQYPTSRT